MILKKISLLFRFFYHLFMIKYKLEPWIKYFWTSLYITTPKKSDWFAFQGTIRVMQIVKKSNTKHLEEVNLKFKRSELASLQSNFSKIYIYEGIVWLSKIFKCVLGYKEGAGTLILGIKLMVVACMHEKYIRKLHYHLMPWCANQELWRIKAHFGVEFMKERNGRWKF